MITPINIFALLLSYLIGSIPSAVWIGKYFYSVDVREYGSGNSGATNTFRVLGKRAGIPVMLLDIFKGWGAVNLPYLILDAQETRLEFVNLQLALSVAVLMGHIFPLFASFRGGKGIATLLGIVVALHPQAALVAIGVFTCVLLVTHYVSLSSMLAAFSFPLSVTFIFPTHTSSLILFAMFSSVLVLITHQKNIERLLKRQENKTRLIKKASDSFNHPPHP